MLDFLWKTSIPGLGKGKYKMNLKHLVVPQHKEILAERWKEGGNDTGANLRSS